MKEAKTYFEKLVGRGRNLASKTVRRMPKGTSPLDQIKSISTELLTARGQASGIKMAEDLHKMYLTCSASEKRAYFEFLLSEFGRDKDRLMATCQSYAKDPSHETLKRLTAEMEPRRQELFKRMNMAPGGTMALVDMRTDLLRFLKSSPELKPVDIDFLSLFKTWFNRGFLTMEPISWKSPAVILERLIAYEAVHEIKSWDDLKSRLDPADRLCYAFFHPNLKDTPLIFVEVALCEAIPNSIQDILSSNRIILPNGQAKVATFYSINNCLTGLKGIYFGNFLLKQVVAHLQVAQPQLKSFVTLSPIPGLKSWLNTDSRAEAFGLESQDIEMLESPLWFKDELFAAKTQKKLRQAALAYLIDRQPNSHRLQDSVARFHLGNGARIENVHWLADTSERGLSNSYGMMVNYLYKLNDIENNHEFFAVRHEIALSGDMRRLKNQIA